MKRVRSSLWFFLILGTLSIVAVVVPIVANLAQQLDADQVALARERWDENGPTNYDLSFLERVDKDEVGDVHDVRVREGRIVRLRVNDKPIDLEAMPAERRRQFTVEGLFDQIAAHLAEQESGGRRKNYATAHFDKTLGFPTHYVRRVRGTRDRLEWIVKLKLVEE